MLLFGVAYVIFIYYNLQTQIVVHMQALLVGLKPKLARCFFFVADKCILLPLFQTQTGQLVISFI